MNIKTQHIKNCGILLKQYLEGNSKHQTPMLEKKKDLKSMISASILRN